MKTINIFSIIIFASHCAFAYKILVIHPAPSLSHQLAPRAIIEGLAAAGHNVTFLTPIPFETDFPSIRQVNLDFLKEVWSRFKFSDGMSVLKLMQLMQEEVPRMVDDILSFPEVKNILQKKNGEEFDAVMVENVCFIPLNAIADVFNTTLIGLTSMEVNPALLRAVGNPIHPLLTSTANIPMPNNPSFMEKIGGLYKGLIMDIFFYYFYLPSNNWVLEKHFDTKLSPYELMQRVDFTIEGQSAVIDNAKPLLPNTVQIGSLHIKPVKSVPVVLKSYLDNSKNGVIYVSFGSNVKSSEMSPEKREILLKTFANLENYDILWKFESDKIENLSKNVKLQKWLPQQDLLAHKNIKAFVTQGGVQSMEEAINRGVPMIVVPFFGDQEYNANKVVDLGIGLKTELTTEALTNAIKEVVENKKYKQKVTIMSQRIKDTIKSPVDTAVWWIEYAIRNRGAEHLANKSAQMSVFEYFLLDVIIVHFLVFASFIFLTLWCCKKSKSDQNNNVNTNQKKLKRK